MENKHSSYDLSQMQSLSLDAKIKMSKERIKNWYEKWKKYTIVNRVTKKERYVTWCEEPNEKGCYVKKNKKINGIVTEISELVKGTKLNINEYIKSEEEGQVYISFSGGKDSTVLKHLVWSLYPDVPVVFIDTGLEYTSVRAKGINEANLVVRPKKNNIAIITNYGYPVISKEVAMAVYECQRAIKNGKELPKYRIDKFEGKKLTNEGNKSPYNMEKYAFLLNAPFRISHLCCNYSKKVPSKEFEKKTGRKVILGTMAEESRLRKTKWIKYGCNGFESKRPTSQPLSFWTEQDILEYIKIYNIKIADAYGNVVYEDETENYKQLSIFDYIGENCSNCRKKLITTKAKRTGCIYCLFGITQDIDRFERLKNEEPIKYDYVMRGGCYDNDGYWIPGKDENGVFGLGYKFVIDWLNEHGNLGIKY